MQDFECPSCGRETPEWEFCPTKYGGRVCITCAVGFRGTYVGEEKLAKEREVWECRNSECGQLCSLAFKKWDRVAQVTNVCPIFGRDERARWEKVIQ